MEDKRSFIGTVLRERYRVERVLGEGAHSTVYHASDLKLDGASWALKEICKGSLPLSERAGIIAHFYREAETLKTLNHNEWATSHYALRPLSRTRLIPVELFEAEKRDLIALPGYIEPPYRSHQSYGELSIM